MATLLTDVVAGESQSEPRAALKAGAWSTRAEWLWTLFGLILLVAFVALVLDDNALRNVLAVR